MEEISVQYGEELTSNACEEALEKEIEQHGEKLEGNACEEALDKEIYRHGEKLEGNACEEALEKEIEVIDGHGEKSDVNACEEALEEDGLVANLKREIECRDEHILKMQERYEETLSSFQQVVNGLAEKINIKDKKLEEMEDLYQTEVNLLVDEKTLITSETRKLQSQNMELDSRLMALIKGKTRKNLECNRMKKEMKVLKEELQKQNAMEVDYIDLESQIEVNQLVDENASLISEIRMLQSQNMKLQDRLRWKSTALQKIKVRKSLECTRLGNEISVLKRELQKQKSSATGINNLDSRISVLKTDLEESFKAIQEARNESTTLKADLEYHQNLSNTLTTKEIMSREELLEARKESITSLKGILSNRTTLVIKRFGEINHKVFQEACSEKFPNDNWEEKSAKLCSLWEGYLTDANWQPFKTVNIKGKLEEIVNDDDEKLKELRDDYGEAVYSTVANALMEMNEHNPSGRYLVPEVWNSKEGRIASVKEIIQYLVKQLKQVKNLKRKR